MTRPTLPIIQGGQRDRPRSRYPRDDMDPSLAFANAVLLSVPVYAFIGAVVWWAFWSGAYRP